jgi:hypothetical protein
MTDACTTTRGGYLLLPGRILSWLVLVLAVTVAQGEVVVLLLVACVPGSSITTTRSSGYDDG